MTLLYVTSRSKTLGGIATSCPISRLPRNGEHLHPHSNSLRTQTQWQVSSPTSCPSKPASGGPQGLAPDKALLVTKKGRGRYSKGDYRNGDDWSSQIISHGCGVHRQKCKSNIGCATRTPAQAQLMASFPWTPARRAAYTHL
jgi:hypothetical protein